MQDRASGARASRWGHETARALAARIGASSMRRSSNECRYKGLRAVIKCAGAATKSVGVTYKMLDRLEIVIGAFECEDGTFELWSLSPAQFRSSMRATRSQGASAGKVGIVARQAFAQSGRSLGRVALTKAG
jgi:hypothetical protein